MEGLWGGHHLWVSANHAFRTGHLRPCHIGPALPCCLPQSQLSLSSARAGEGQFSRASQPVRGGASPAQPLDVRGVPSSCPNQGHPHDL